MSNQTNVLDRPLPNQIAHDGLSDEQGPIPAFGPAKLDEHGRIVMSDEEWEARRAAVRRALKAIEQITDESDDLVDWDEVMRGIEGR